MIMMKISSFILQYIYDQFHHNEDRENLISIKTSKVQLKDYGKILKYYIYYQMTTIFLVGIIFCFCFSLFFFFEKTPF
jgi:hypothetical protein